MTGPAGPAPAWHVLFRTSFTYRSTGDLREGRFVADQTLRERVCPATYLAVEAADIGDRNNIQGRLVAAGLQSVHSGPLPEDEAHRLAASMNEAMEVLES